MAIKELSDASPDGTRLGQSAADLVGFHGASPTAQLSVIANLTSAELASTTAISNKVNQVLAGLRTKGLLST